MKTPELLATLQSELDSLKALVQEGLELPSHVVGDYAYNVQGISRRYADARTAELTSAQNHYKCWHCGTEFHAESTFSTKLTMCPSCKSACDDEEIQEPKGEQPR